MKRVNGNFRAKNIITKIKNSVYRFKSRSDIVEGRISELEDGS